MGRPRTPIGTCGDISYVKGSGARVRARTRYRDDDGQVRRVSATGATNKEAERNLKKVLIFDALEGVYDNICAGRGVGDRQRRPGHCGRRMAPTVISWPSGWTSRR